MIIKFVLIFVAINVQTFSAFVHDGVVHVEKVVKHFNDLKNSTWKAHHNNLHNVTISHIKSKLGLLSEKKEYVPDEHRDHESVDQLPEFYDSREAFPYCTSLSTIIDQSNCESCWAVSTAAVLSDRFCIRSKGKINVLLSIANLLACNKANDGCNGGVMFEAWEYVKEHGLVTGGGYGSQKGCQPYTIAPMGSIMDRPNVPSARTPRCHKNHCFNRRYKYKTERTYKTSKTIRLPEDEEKIKREIYKNGPVTAGMEVYLPFIFYKSGIFQSHGSADIVGLHAIRLIGWGTENGVKYWIGANSWGKSWGEDGFFKIKRGSNHCQIESMVHAGQPIINEI